MDASEICRRAKRARDQKANWRELYQECYRFGLPNRNLYDGNYETNLTAGGGQKKTAQVFDATAVNSTQRFANRIQSGLFPPQQPWCKMEPGDDIAPEQRIAVQQALDIFGDRMFAVLRRSNFDVAIGEFLLDLAVGTAAMMVERGDAEQPIRFTPVPLFLIHIEEGPAGQVENVYRDLDMPIELLVRKYPGIKLSAEQKQIQRDDPQKKIKVLEAVTYDDRRGDYKHCIVDEAEKREMWYRRAATSPWIVARYMKVAGETYGRGPLTSALSDIKTLNKTVEFLLKNASISIAGIYTAMDDGVLNPQTIRLRPGTIIPVARNGGSQGPSLQPLGRAGDVNLSQLVIDTLQTNIKRALLDESLPPDNMSARSATEIVERMRELAQNLGSAFGRMISEIMTPVVTRVLAIMDEMGIIEMPLRINGLEVRVTPTSPLARAQSLDQVQSILQWAQIAQGLGIEGQAAVKTEVIPDVIADMLGIPAAVRTTPDERQSRIEQLVQQQAAMMFAQQGGMNQMVQAAAQGGGNG